VPPYLVSPAAYNSQQFVCRKGQQWGGGGASDGWIYIPPAVVRQIQLTGVPGQGYSAAPCTAIKEESTTVTTIQPIVGFPLHALRAK